MKSTDERMVQVLQRASATRRKQRRQMQLIAVWGGGVACVAILAVVSLAISSVGDLESVSSLTMGDGELVASVFSGSSTLGYLVVGVLGALLGVALTVLAYRLGRSTGADDAFEREGCSSIREDSSCSDDEGLPWLDDTQAEQSNHAGGFAGHSDGSAGQGDGE